MTETIHIVPITKTHAEAIATWVYDDIYAFYNHDKDFVEECMDGNHFAFTDADGALLGYLCFGQEARIPTREADAYSDDFLDIGLHMKPDLTGRKLGGVFLQQCLDFARENFGVSHFCATIASFNSRAIALCTRAGFSIEREVTHLHSGKKFTIVKRDA